MLPIGRRLLRRPIQAGPAQFRAITHKRVLSQKDADKNELVDESQGQGVLATTARNRDITKFPTRKKLSKIEPWAEHIPKELAVVVRPDRQKKGLKIKDLRLKWPLREDKKVEVDL
jgi:hypothetical protein